MRKIRISARVLLVLLLALATEARPLFAQVKSSAITGTVTDTTGAVVPNAAITVTEQETNVSTTAQSNDKGEYSVPYLPIGKYTLSVTATGFSTYKKTDINLAGATTVRADVPMAIGSTTSSIEVTANALAIQTENATVSDAVSSATITNQANINGNSLYFATLESGVVGDPQQLASTSLGVGYADRRNMSGMRINGGEIGSNDIQLDGISIQGAAWHETAVLPNADALAEVRVTTSAFTADTGMAQGVVSQTTKNGTNQFHGDLNFMMRNEDLNANSFSNKHQGIARPTYRLLQGGGSVGGPVIIPKLYNGRDKLFFFGSFLRLTHSNSTYFQGTVPTLLERVGDFSQTQIKGNSGAATNVNIYNPFTATLVPGSTTQYVRSQYAGNKVTNASPYGLAILQGYPVPNATYAGGPALAAGGGQDYTHVNNFAYNYVSPEYRNSFNGRIDYKLRSNQSIFFSAGISNGGITNPIQWGNLANGPWVNQVSMGDVVDKNPYGAIGDTIVINPTTVLDVRYGITHINTEAQVRSAVGNPAPYGQPAFVAAAAPFGPNNLPGVPAITPYSALNSNSYGNKKEHQLNHFVTGSLSKVKGRLTMKFGAEYRVYLQNYTDIQWQSPPITTNNYSGQYASSNGLNVTALEPLNQNQGFIPASVAAGVEGWQMNAGTAPKLALASKYTAVYSQNTYRPTAKWLLSFGIRYEVQPGPTERYNRMSSFVLDQTNPFTSGATINPTGNLGYLTFPGVGGYSRNLYETTWNNVAPRVGATYQLSNNTVLRGGYGRNYLPSNTGYNANGTIYNPIAFDTAVNAIPFGLAPNGLPAGTFDQASNTYVIPPPGPVQAAANYGGTGSVTIFNRTLYKTGHTDQWNFFIEQQLSSTWLVNAGYVGSKGATLPWRGYLLNGPFAVNPTTLAGWRASWIASGGATDPAQAQVANPMPGLIGKAAGDSGLTNITAMEANEPYVGLLNVTDYVSIGSSNYNSLVLKVQHSTSHGLTFGANYTWAKNTGLVGNSATQTFAESQQSNAVGPTGGVDYYNIKNNHSILDYDIANRFVLNGAYALPFGKGQLFGSNRIANVFIGGWSTTAALVLQGGMPWGPNCAAQTNSVAGTLNGRCNPVAGQPLELPKSQQRYYNGTETLTLPDGRSITPPVNTYMKWNPDAFTIPTVALPQSNGTIKYSQDQYVLGSTPLSFSNMRTPGIQNLNLSVIKIFPITERVSFDLHVNATNALNHTNHTFVSNSGVTANNTVTVNTAPSATNGLGTNSNNAFGSYGLTTLEARQLTIQANFTF
jgi:hypothetical protein